MLVPSNLSLTTAMVNPRQIAVTTSVSSTVMYTVPAGKKFVGYIYATAATGQYSVTPSGGTAVSFSASALIATSSSTTPMQLVFVAGTIITCAANVAIVLNGIESDL
jgi:hypothetical protein